MHGLLAMLETIDKDDSFRVGFFSFAENLMLCLRQDFGEFLPAVFPHVNNGANIHVECKLVDATVPSQQINNPD
jgi:hypothetical protein